MSKLSKQLGDQGEKFVVAHLQQTGYRIIRTNYTTKFGEIDIIAEEGDELCFIEVKTRSDDEMGDGLEAITPRKKWKLTKVALAYLQEHDLDDTDARFDVVAVSGNPEWDVGIEIIKNAFERVGNQW